MRHREQQQKLVYFVIRIDTNKAQIIFTLLSLGRVELYDGMNGLPKYRKNNQADAIFVFSPLYAALSGVL